MNFRTTTSRPFSTLPGFDIPWIIGRACSGQWDYAPHWLELVRHPSMSRFAISTRMFTVPDLEDRSVKVGVEVVRREAAKRLVNREVKHFEVVAKRQDGVRRVPHEMCREQGCDGCRGLGALLMADKSSHVDLMGWVAVISVA